MSLGIALNNAISGLKINQQSFAVLSQNIANANNEDYTRQSISQASLSLGSMFGSGVEMKAVNRVADDYISKSVITRSSTVSRASVISDFYEQIQLRMGSPGQGNSLDTYINSYFNSLSSLSISTDVSTPKIIAVEAAESLSGYVSNLAKDVNQLRVDADNQIKDSVDIVNNELKNIFSLNRSLLSAQSTGQSPNSLKDSIATSLAKIAEHIDITYRTTEEGIVTISTATGVELLGSNLGKLEYKSAATADNFINGTATPSLTVAPVDEFGQVKGSITELITSGTPGKIESLIGAGKIAGAMEIRDTILPDILAQLDNLAANIRDTVNAIHNDGTSYPPPASLTGTTLIDPTQSVNWSGSFMIAALDSSGKPIASPYASESNNGYGYAPLTINLGNLNDGAGAGKPSYQAIIDEINQYYGTPQNRVGLGQLTNIELVSRSDALTAGAGTFNFDLETTNLTGLNGSVRVTNAAISGGGTITSPASFPSASFQTPKGTTSSTTGVIDFSVDTSTAGPGPYTVTLDVETTDQNGVVTTGQITYTLNNDTSALRNDRYAPATASGAAAIEAPTSINPILVAKLVDENGLEVPKNSLTGDYIKSGYLQITSVNSSTFVGMSELTSSFKGDSLGTPPVAGTNRGFSHQLGLNNFFADNGSTKNAALSFKVSDAITKDPQRFALGKLTLSNQPSDSAANPKYTYGIGNGSNQVVNAMAELAKNAISFSSAGSLPSTKLSFASYAAEIMGFTSQRTAAANETLRQEELVQQGFADRDKAIRGVNIDEEMANTIIFQNAYSANARVINVVKDLFDTLLSSVGN